MKHNEQPGSLDQMAERFRREIFGYIQTKVGDRAAAEDLTQETFLKVQNSLSKGTEPEHFRGWIYKIARNAVVDFMNRRRRFLAFDEAPNAAEIQQSEFADPIDSEFRQGLFSYASKVIEGMPTEDREALTLTELDGFSREELANHLGISVSAAKSRVVRARAKLRKAIEDCCRLITDPYGKVIGWQRRGTDCCRR
ncbi:MAG TPA: sigma-70 family RNA polymerase sigma factor [Chthoniobacterales bacterium]|jgi:RNA polymerase sigma-70 factor (ECF subfamily)|nr:sigma-70 family RNA polymerase sigma factor [Chthoniobacterales bacterium]